MDKQIAVIGALAEGSSIRSIERITGIPKEQFLKAADLYTSVRKDGDMKKASTIIYAVGWTQHSFGTQIIRTAAVLQLLMGLFKIGMILGYAPGLPEGAKGWPYHQVTDRE